MDGHPFIPFLFRKKSLCIYLFIFCNLVIIKNHLKIIHQVQSNKKRQLKIFYKKNFRGKKQKWVESAQVTVVTMGDGKTVTMSTQWRSSWVCDGCYQSRGMGDGRHPCWQTSHHGCTPRWQASYCANDRQHFYNLHFFHFLCV